LPNVIAPSVAGWSAKPGPIAGANENRGDVLNGELESGALLTPALAQ
jgi:hypothetical protein